MGISLDAPTQIISITSPTTEVTIQTLLDTIRAWEAELPHMTDPPVIHTDGKTDLTGGAFTAITLTLSSTWQIQFWSGVSLGIITDGNLVGGVGDQPIKPTGGTDTIIVNNQVGGVIVTMGGSIPTVEAIREEMDAHSTKLANIDTNVIALFDESGGKWEIVGNQMIFYKEDNITEIMRFNLFDSSGNPSMTEVYSRERVS